MVYPGEGFEPLDHPEFASFDQKDMHMPEVTICCGMTETAPVSTQSRTDDPTRSTARS
jgi:hypothetical protein